MTKRTDLADEIMRRRIQFADRSPGHFEMLSIIETAMICAALRAANERYETAHRQIQATVDRLGAENERLRSALQGIADMGCDGPCGRLSRRSLTLD